MRQPPSNSQVSGPSNEEPETAPFVTEQQSRAALLLVVRCDRAAGDHSDTRIWGETERAPFRAEQGARKRWARPACLTSAARPPDAGSPLS
jgi:hypothetical protein